MTIQANVVPFTFELRAIEVVSPLQIVEPGGVAITFGVGSTVTVTVMEVPMHPFGEMGVIV
jgi:hypothetical protein